MRRSDGNAGNLAWTWALGLFALAMWFLCLWAGEPRAPATIPATGKQFSVANAERVLARILGPEKPHPVSTDENTAVRGRILQEFAALGIPARTYRAFTCRYGFGGVGCATVTDVIADVIPGRGKAIAMLAHYDSVPAGPGASDDQSGVATILETARALRAGHAKSLHPVMAVITDGEEAGLLGANAFLENPALEARVGAAVNAEARGTSGPSLLFQTSPGDARLIDLYAAHVPAPATSSLFAEIYKRLPNDTDLTLFINAGFISYNFAFSENLRYYHSPMDTRRHLSRASFNMHGNNVLGTVEGLEQTEFAALKGGNHVYVSILQMWLPRIPSEWALPLSLIAFFVISFAGWRARTAAANWRGWLCAALMPPFLVVLCALLGFLLAFIAQAISGMPDPTYAYPIAMRIALGLAVWGATLLVSRMADVHGAALSAWLWMSGLAIVAAAVLPGLSPYLLFPSIVAAPLLLIMAFTSGEFDSQFGQAALFLAAIPAFLIWFPLVVSGEGLMGLRLHPLFTIPAAFGLMTLVPLIVAHPVGRQLWGISVTAAFAIALGGAIVTGLLPAYSPSSPQRLNLVYYENGKSPARWIADTAWKAKSPEAIPRSLKRAGNFRFEEDAYAGLGIGAGEIAAAGPPRYPLPVANVLSDNKAGPVRHVTIRLRGSGDTDALALFIPRTATLIAIDIRGQHIAIPKDAAATRILCLSRDCRDLTVNLALRSAGTMVLNFAERRYGLPPFGRPLAAMRPNTAMPSQSGDGVFLVNSLKLPP
jgi:hypothetical protein